MPPSTESARSPGVGRRSAIVACGAPVTHHTSESLRGRPLQDFTILDGLFDCTFIDTHTAMRSRLDRLVASRFGDSWVIAYRAVLAARRADVIIAMGDDVGVPITAMKALLWCRTPFVMICWHMQSKRSRLFLGRLRLQWLVQLFLSQSSRQRDLIVRAYRVPPEKVRLLHATVDHHYFTTAEAGAVRPLISSAGMAARDYHTLIEATRGLDADVVIEAASAWFSEPLNFSSTDLHDRIELSNVGTTTGLRDIYASSQIVVVPLQGVKHSAGDTTIVEGMAMGKPVVASAIPMLGDYITDGESGFVVPVGDVAAMRSRLVQLLDDPALRTSIGAAARRTVEERFTLDHYRQRVLDAVDHVTS